MNEKEQNDYDGELLEDSHTEIKEPELWRIILLNDDYTPRDFVVEILVSIFHKPPIDATKIMMEVHNNGQGMVGLYPYDIGRTKVSQVVAVSQKREYPLKVILERA